MDPQPVHRTMLLERFKSRSFCQSRSATNGPNSASMEIKHSRLPTINERKHQPLTGSFRSYSTIDRMESSRIVPKNLRLPTINERNQLQPITSYRSHPGLDRIESGSIVYKSMPAVNDQPLITSFRSYPAVQLLYRPRESYIVAGPATMTRLLYTPNRSNFDVRSGANITRSVSTSNISNSYSNIDMSRISIASIPSLHSYNNIDLSPVSVGSIPNLHSYNNIDMSRITTNNIPCHHSYSDMDVSCTSIDSKKTETHNQPQHISPHYVQHKNQHGFSSSTSNLMSLLRDVPGRTGTPVSRSQSFGGLSLSSNRWSGSTLPVLGDTLRKNQRAAIKLPAGPRSFRKPNRVPKIPRPARALMVFNSVKRGIREFIQTTQEDIVHLMAAETTSSSHSLSSSTSQQIKAAERYLKKLEFHLAKVDELHDCYLLNQQLREGARNMAKAFIASDSLNRKASVASIKCGYKECSQIMCAIEAQLENMLGSLSCRLKGITGFARMVPGDVFEVVIKHGSQKWRSRGRIEKNSSQCWDVPDFTFKCLVGDLLKIKVSEVRALKSVRLGQKNCEICNPSKRDATNQGLFSVNPQLMTVNINVQGSLKLSLIVTWNPLDGTDELIKFLEPPSHTASSAAAARRQHLAVRSTSASSIGSSSDIMSRLSPLPAQRDDSGIYGSATSLPSSMTSDLGGHQQAHSLSASSMTSDPGHHQQLQALSASGTLTSDQEHQHLHKKTARGPLTSDLGPHSLTVNGTFWTADPCTDRLRPHSVIDAEMRNPQAPQPTSSMTDISHSSEPGSTCLSSPCGSLTVSSTSISSPVLSFTTWSSAAREVTQNMIPGLELLSVVPHDSISSSLDEALRSLTTSLADFRGQYPVIHKLEEMVQAIDILVNKSSGTHSRSRSVSESIEGTIEEVFHFLNTEDLLDDDDDDDDDEGSHADEDSKVKTQVPDIEEMIVSPNSTAKTADSGIGSLTKRLQEDVHSDTTPQQPSCGSEQVDRALVFHLTYCDKLLENLGNVGPLKCREVSALHLLQQQAGVLEKLVRIVKAGTELDLHAVLCEETSDKSLRELWVLSVDQTPLYVQPGKIVTMLEHKFGARLSEQCTIRPDRVFQHLMARMLYVSTYEPEIGATTIITLHQFMLYFRDGDGVTKVREIAEELQLLDRLSASSSDTATEAVHTLKEGLPSPVCLKMLTKLLVSNSQDSQRSAFSYLRAIGRDKVQRDQAIGVLVEGLEDHITEVRAGCCVAFSIFEAEEHTKLLVHVSRSDLSSTVRRKAKEALYSFGDSGRQAVEETQQVSHRFQAVQVHRL